MTDAGFFRGTSADQDNRFANKQKKLLKELNFSPVLNTKLNMSKIELESLKPWVEQKIKDILEKDDEILSNSVYEHLQEKEPDGKNLLVLITGFVDDVRASKFVEELWTRLIDIQEEKNGTSPSAAPKSPGNGVSQTEASADADQPESNTDGQPVNESDRKLAEAGDETPTGRKSRSRSRSHTPPAKDQHSKSRSPSHSNSEKSPSKSGAKSPPKSGSKSPSDSRSRSVSRSKSRSKSRSRSRSSRSHSVSHSRSKSGSSSRSLRRSRSRSRSPNYRGNRLRRSRSRSGSYRRRSRSPRGRRGYSARGPYRGGYSYDRRRGPPGPPRRRPSPMWSRRRFSPRSPPLRRRRTPSISPRRRSRSPAFRHRSPSRTSPYGHMMSRKSPPRHLGPVGMGRGPRHIPHHHDMHRPLPPVRSPRLGPMDHRSGYGMDGPMLPRHSPGPMMGRSHDLPPISHPVPGPSKPYSSPSPSSGRKKHKKEKKHRKHKKSKRHRSATPEKRKKHKKHKKTKKHKS